RAACRRDRVHVGGLRGAMGIAVNPAFFDVPVRGGSLRVARWGEAERIVLGVHGITASSISLAPIARHLGEEVSLVAPDLRGRGGSSGLPGSYGIGVHAE